VIDPQQLRKGIARAPTNGVPHAVLPFHLRPRCHVDMRPTDRNRSRMDAEARFPIKIDIRVPGNGEPWPFAEMLAWCHANITTGAWA